MGDFRERFAGWDFPWDTEEPWDIAEITMSGKSSEMVDGVVECPIIRRKKDLHFDCSFYKIPLTPFAKGGTLYDLLHLSKAETSHAEY